VTEPGAGEKTKSGWTILGINFGWLGWSVSLGSVLIVLVVLGLAAGIFVVAGGVNVSADKPDGWVTRHLLHFVFKRSEASRSGGDTPPADLSSPARVHLAAQHFDMVCANCHGRPGFGQSVIALSMSPRPQYLPNVVGQFTDRELYRIVEHGVKFSAMPSWPTADRGDEVWSMVAFLRQLPKLDANAYQEMTALPTVQGPTPASPAGDSALRSANAKRNQPPFDEFLYAAPASGFSDGSIHQNPAATCARCHGPDGSGAVTGGEAPNLTIQNADYLQAALNAYTSGARKSGFMQNIAAQLSGAQISALSGYYANLPMQTAPSAPADPALVARGEMIATHGIRESAIPACDTCHESGGSQIVDAPNIAGQSAIFLRHELAAMAHGGRGSTVMWNPMPTVAHELSDKDIAAVAAYYAGLKPAKSAGGGQAAQQQAMLPKINMGAAQKIFETTCVKCHVNGGRGDLAGNYPNLTIQTAPYAVHSLYAFHAHLRRGGKMQEVADSLNFDQMAGLANYLNSLTPQPALAKPDAAAAARGAAIAMNGVPARGVPACLSCHSEKGVAALPLIPTLQGQNVAYLRKKLNGFSAPYPVNRNALNPMPAIASRLTDQERADLAAYFAAAAPLQKPAARP
jgi:cytochrome c553